MKQRYNKFSAAGMAVLLVGALLLAWWNQGRLGHGYRLKHYTDSRPRTQLWHGSRPLRAVSSYAISPSGRFALFTDDACCSLWLYDQSSDSVRSCTRTNHLERPLQSVVWKEDQGVVEVTLMDKPSRRIDL